MKRITLPLITSVFAMLILLASCKKEPETITVIEKETITVTDTIYTASTDTILKLIQDTATTFILVRHAETTGIGSNPNLSATGTARALELSNILGGVDLDAVYSTNYNRTTQTATPTATDKGLSVTTYDAFNLSPFADDVLNDYPKGIILAVGHSNTTSSLLNVLTGTVNYPNIPETEYNNFYVVSVYEKGKATVLEMKYGD